jgi:hypothetical protein
MKEPWTTSLTAAVAVLDNVTGVFQLPPDGTEIEALLAAWSLFRVPLALAEPAPAAAKAWAAKLSGPHVKENVLDAVRLFVAGLDTRIGEALHRGERDRRLIRTADFGGLRFISSGQFHESGKPIMLAVGLWDTLSASSPVHGLLPATELYRHGGVSLAMVLGPAHDSAHPRLWYWAVEAVKLTRHFRAIQVTAESEQAERTRRESEADRQAFFATELGLLAARLDALEKLRADGKLPTLKPAEPAVNNGHAAEIAWCNAKLARLEELQREAEASKQVPVSLNLEDHDHEQDP